MKQWLASVHPYWKLAAIIVVFVGVSLGNITRWSVWFDEAFSAYIVKFDFFEIVRYTAYDVHPPLYYWLLKLWTMLFGSGELVFRSMSVLFAIVAIIGLYALVSRIMKSRSAGLVAAFAASISPMLVRYSEEARMYTLVLAIVIWAAYVLVRAQSSHRKDWWVLYALLLALGMYTHYFAALGFAVFWFWRWYEVRCGNINQFWTKPWILSHALAVLLFVPWIPIVAAQFTSVQSGFWIPPLSAYTPIDYLSNMLLYSQYGAVTGWWAVIFYVALVIGGWAVWRYFSGIGIEKRRQFGMIILLALLPPTFLVIASLPPLASSFIDRYVMYAQIMLAALVGVALWGLRDKYVRAVPIAAAILIITAGLGISNVYYYGNYNKNSSTSIMAREAVELAQRNGQPGQPIVTHDVWLFYEMAFYNSDDNRVYYVDSPQEYTYGSTRMLSENDFDKIKDLESFATRHRYIWYVDKPHVGDVKAPVDGWRQLVTYTAVDPIDGKTFSRTTLYDTQTDS